MRNTPLKAFTKSPIKHSEKSHKAEHAEKTKKHASVKDKVYKPEHPEANHLGYVPASLVKD